MTRDEFIEEMCSISALVDFCWSENIDGFVDYYRSSDSIDEYLDDMFSDMFSYRRWYDIRDWMNDVPEGYDWYDTEDDICGYNDDEYEDLKDRILEYLDDDGFFDEPDDDEEQEEDEEEQKEPCVPDEEAEQIDFSEFVSINRSFLITVEEAKHKQEEENADFSMLF